MDENPTDPAETSEEEPTSFSPNERRLITQPLDLSVQTLVDQWGEKLLILPDIQREYIWDDAKASRLIESLMMNIPIPVLYFAETEQAQYEIFDGHQRTRSIVRYINNEFALNGLAVLTEHRGKRFFELPDRDQRFLKMRTLRVILITVDSHPNMKFEIYERLNTGSLLLNAQELRNSIYRGTLNKLLHKCAKEPVFRTLIGTKLPRHRMVDEEMILRFFAMRSSLGSYRPSLKRFLNEYADKTKDLPEKEAEELYEKFLYSINLVYKVLGSSAFRVLNENGERLESTVNRALFEAQMLSFSWIKKDDTSINEADIRIQIAKLFASDVFMDSIQRATGDRSRTFRRVRDTTAALKAAGVDITIPFELK